jgi:endonuclease/exonuclease/phosphatase family metal-dependent hydrolase
LIDKLLAGNYDVVLLQEVDEAFVKSLRKRMTRNFTRAPRYNIVFKLPLDRAVEEEDGLYLNQQ